MVQTPLMQPTTATPQQVSLLWLAGLHVAALVVGHVLGSKSAELGPFLVTLTILTFPVTFLTTDLLNELQGHEWARRVTAIGLTAVALAYALIELARRLPVAIGSHLPPDAFDHVLSVPFAHAIALLSGYAFGQLADIDLFHRLRKFTKGKRLWIRVLASTAAGELVDGLVVTAFVLFAPAETAGRNLVPDALEATWDQALLRLLMMVALLPIIYLFHLAHLARSSLRAE